MNKSKDERTDYVTGNENKLWFKLNLNFIFIIEGGDSGDAQQSSFMTIFKQVFIQGLNALLVKKQKQFIF